MRRYFEVDNVPIGDGCAFLAVSSAQCQCEILLGETSDTMVLDAGVIQFLHAANALAATPEPKAKDANFAIAAEQLGLAALHRRDHVAALNYKVAALSWGTDRDRLRWRSREALALLDLQTTFLVLHEMYHWALDKSETLRRITDGLYANGFAKHLCNSVRSQLSPDAIRAHAAHITITDADIAYHAGLADESERWVEERKEELICDFLALRVLMLDIQSPFQASRAVFAAAALHSVLQIHAATGELVAGGPQASAAIRQRERDTQARYFVFAAMPEAAAIASNARVDSRLYRDMYMRYTERSLVPICAARDVLAQMQGTGELSAMTADAGGVAYSWDLACDAFDVVPRSVPFRWL
jgi:F0F1-type ATP synthase membrane subunit c/vacuolar-type H+-ATPase subunit K